MIKLRATITVEYEFDSNAYSCSVAEIVKFEQEYTNPRDFLLIGGRSVWVKVVLVEAPDPGHKNPGRKIED